MSFVRNFVLVICYSILVGCVTSDLHWQNTETTTYQKQTEKEKANIIVYREKDAIDGNAINIYINGEYLTSLQPNAYSQYNVCPTSQRLFSEFTGKDAGYKDKARLGSYYNLTANQLNFFRIINVNGNPVLQPVDAEQANIALAKMPKQVNTLPRVEQKQCELVKHYNLSASALFAFNSGTKILPFGEQEIAKIANEAQQNNLNIKRIEVIGYTDPVGQNSYNQKLSLQRANTIKNVLVRNGMSTTPIQTIGRGSENLLVANCQNQHPNNKAKQNECNQPNRRVEVIMYLNSSN